MKILYLQIVLLYISCFCGNFESKYIFLIRINCVNKNILFDKKKYVHICCFLCLPDIQNTMLKFKYRNISLRINFRVKCVEIYFIHYCLIKNKKISTIY